MQDYSIAARSALTSSMIGQIKEHIGKCEFCHEKMAGHFNIFEVHHITHVKYADGIQNLNTAENLIVLCPNCHAKAHKGVYSVAILQSAISGRGRDTIAWMRQILHESDFRPDPNKLSKIKAEEAMPIINKRIDLIKGSINYFMGVSPLKKLIIIGTLIILLIILAYVIYQVYILIVPFFGLIILFTIYYFSNRKPNRKKR